MCWTSNNGQFFLFSHDSTWKTLKWTRNIHTKLTQQSYDVGHHNSMRQFGATKHVADVGALFADGRKRNDYVDVGLFLRVEKVDHVGNVASRCLIVRQHNQLAGRASVRFVHVAIQRTLACRQRRRRGIDTSAAAQKRTNKLQTNAMSTAAGNQHSFAHKSEENSWGVVAVAQQLSTYVCPFPASCSSATKYERVSLSSKRLVLRSRTHK